ncbi:hypothetical protein T492DRAFT_895658, partial [Pavlovales sp. CCMP2436]
ALLDEPEFVSGLLAFDKEALAGETSYTALSEFDPVVARRTSAALGALVQWVTSLVAFNRAGDRIRPVLVRVRALELDARMHEWRVHEAEKLAVYRSLVAALVAERPRWVATRAAAAAERATLAADAAVAAAIIAYGAPMPADTRKSFAREILALCCAHELRTREAFEAGQWASSGVQRARWEGAGLPSGCAHALGSALALRHGAPAGWPLLLDPQVSVYIQTMLKVTYE